MAENGSTIEDTIRTYLASRGGSVEAPEGRGLTDEMARAIGVDPPLALSPILRDMESNGLIRRQVQGLLTYRIELVTPADPVTAPHDTPATTGNGALAGSDTIPPVAVGEAPADATASASDARTTQASASGSPAPPTMEMPAATAEGEAPPATTDQLSVATPERTAPVRKASGRRAPRPKREILPLPGDEAPAGALAAAAETTTLTPAPGAPDTVTPVEEAPPAVVAPPVSAPDPAGTVPPPTAAEPAAESAPAVTPAVVPPSEPAPTPEGHADATATQPIAAATAAPDGGAGAATEVPAPVFDSSVVSPTSPPPPSSAPADAPFVNPWGTPVPSAPPAGAPGGPAAAATTTTTTKTKTRRIRTEGLRSRLEMPVQDIRSEPNQTTIIAVAVAGIGLVLIAIIAVIVAHATTHHAATGTFSQSTDACRVVTADDASTLFGVDAGNPHFVLGTCVYDTGSNELIVAVFRQQARAMYETARSSDARDIANVGDSAYYQDGRLRILKGTNLLELTVSPIPPNWPSPKMLTLANTALGRL